MSTEKVEKENPTCEETSNKEVEDIEVTNLDDEMQDTNEELEIEVDENTKLQSRIEELELALAKEKKEYLFLMAEFDNFRKRSIKEKGEIIRNGAESALKNLLPIIDDFERGIQASETTEDVKAVKDGIELIYNKFIKYLEQNGVKAIMSENQDFDTELHEAVTTFPAPDESLKGKVIDTVQKGYTLNDKVLRHSKVVVGQ